jgi:hypothetical protein
MLRGDELEPVKEARKEMLLNKKDQIPWLGKCALDHLPRHVTLSHDVGGPFTKEMGTI